jgi:uncharacterized protein YozE (UPF0346 family)
MDKYSYRLTLYRYFFRDKIKRNGVDSILADMVKQGTAFPAHDRKAYRKMQL